MVLAPPSSQSFNGLINESIHNVQVPDGVYQGSTVNDVLDKKQGKAKPAAAKKPEAMTE